MQEMVEVDSRELRRFMAQHVTFAEIAYPRATRWALTQTAYYQQRVTQKDLPQKLTLRNPWTKRSIRWNEAKPVPVARQFSEAGSTEQYMERQYEGFVSRSEGKHGVPIPTSFSAGQYGAKPRTKMVRRAHLMAKINIAKYEKRGKTQKQRNVRAVQEGLEQRKRFVFMSFKRSKGIFKIVGGRKVKGGFKKGWPDGARLKMVWGLRDKVVHTKPHDWHSKGEDRAYRRFEETYRRAIVFQMRRMGM